MTETPYQRVLRLCGLPGRNALLCAFQRFQGLSTERQTSENFVRIMIPFLEDEGDTWFNSGIMCVLLDISGKLDRNQEAKLYARTRGGIWNIEIYTSPPGCQVYTLRKVIDIIDSFGTKTKQTSDRGRVSRKGTIY